MAIRPPLQKPKLEPVEIEALIEKGASVKEDCKEKEEKKWTIINVRMSTEMLKNVDKFVSNRVGITRTGWILEAIHEKLKKEAF